MNKNKKQLFIISLGGSLINPGEIDVNFLKNFKILVTDQIKKGSKFILITGGGAPARNYISALSKISQVSNTDKDWMGIQATRLNGHLVRLTFGKLANKQVIEDPNVKVNFKEKILIAGGWMPGRSTDDDAVRLAKVYKASTVINLSNIDFLYNKDPRKYTDAIKITNTTWKELRKIVGNKWNPGNNLPFDPTAAKLAEKLKLKVIIANGKDLDNLRNILNGNPFKGTTIA